MTEEQYTAINQILGFPGAMLSGSKSSYLQARPSHEVFFNACLFVEGRQVWHGDVDLTQMKEGLQDLANRIGPYVLTRETPFRWDGLEEGRKREPESVREFTPDTPLTPATDASGK